MFVESVSETNQLSNLKAIRNKYFCKATTHVLGETFRVFFKFPLQTNCYGKYYFFKKIFCSSMSSDN